MDKGSELLVKISDAIGACRLNPTIRHEFTIRMPEKIGGGTFKISVQNADQSNKQSEMIQSADVCKNSADENIQTQNPLKKADEMTFAEQRAMFGQVITNKT